MVMSWMINTMINDIQENFLLYRTAKAIWDVDRETYANFENTLELFEIEVTLHDLHQEDLSVTQYFNILTRHWQQLDMFEVHAWKCSDDSVIQEDCGAKAGIQISYQSQQKSGRSQRKSNEF